MDAGIVLGIIGIVIAVVALMVGVPPLLAMLFGAPKITAEFVTTPYGLDCRIVNTPIVNRWLHRMKVTRREPEVSIHFTVEDRDGGKLIVEPTNAFDRFSGHNPNCVLSVYSPEQFSIAAWRNNEPEVGGLWPDGKSQWRRISQGTYTASIFVKDFAANDLMTFTRDFVVGENVVEMKWLEPTS
jgi:hypothetical protein